MAVKYAKDKFKDDLPDLKAKDVQDATVKIQSVFRGYQARKENATVAKPFEKQVLGVQQGKKNIMAVDTDKEALEREDLPNLESKEVQDAAIKIQSVYKGFCERRNLSAGDTVKQVMAVKYAKDKFKDDLPDLKAKDVQDATVKIQSVFRGYQARKENATVAKPFEKQVLGVQQGKKNIMAVDTDKEALEREDLPNLESKEVQDAAIKIQSVYKGFCERRNLSAGDTVKQVMAVKCARDKFKDDRPDLKAKDVQDATAKIQYVFRGYQARKANATVAKAVKKHQGKKQMLAVHSDTDALESEEMPNLESKEVQDAAIKIQSMYKGFCERKKISAGDTVNQVMAVKYAKEKFKDDLPDLKAKDVQDATVKIQSVFRGYHARKENTNVAKPVEKHVIKQQQGKKQVTAGGTDKDALDTEDLPNLKSKEVQDAAVKIQSMYKGFCQRKKKSAGDTVRQLMAVKYAKEKFKDDLPDLKAKDVQDATVKIQSVFRGYQARKENGTVAKPVEKQVIRVHQGKKQIIAVETDGDALEREDLPNLESKEVQDAAVKIQSVYKGFCERKKLYVGDSVKQVMAVKYAKEKFKDDLPDLKAKDVQDATVKIQSVFRGYQARKENATVGKKQMMAVHSDMDALEREEMPNLESKEVQDAAIKIQSMYKGFCERKKLTAGDTVRQVIAVKYAKGKFKDDLPDLKARDVLDATLKIQSVFRGYQARKQSTSNRISGEQTLNVNNDKEKEHTEELPDLNSKDVKDAVIKIQGAYKGFQVRKGDSAGDTVSKVVAVKAAEKKFTDNGRRQAMGRKADLQSSSSAPDTVKKVVVAKNAKDKILVSGSKQALSKRADSQSSASEEAKELPDLNARDVKEAAVKIQEGYRGFQTRKKVCAISTRKPASSSSSSSEEAEELPDLNAKDVKEATATIQAAYKGFQMRKKVSDVGRRRTIETVNSSKQKFTDRERKPAIVRKADSQSSSSEEAEELPDTDAKDVKDAAIKIQAAYKGFQSLQTMKKVVVAKNTKNKILGSGRKQALSKGADIQSSSSEEAEELPDLNARDVKEAAVKIQAGYRGFQTRKKVCAISTREPVMIRKTDFQSSSSEEAEELPDLNAKDVKEAAAKIQAAYKGFQTRKKVSVVARRQTIEAVGCAKQKLTHGERKPAMIRKADFLSSSSEVAEELPDLEAKDVKDAAIKIQAAYRGFQSKKRLSAPDTVKKIVAKTAEEKFSGSGRKNERADSQSSSSEEAEELPDLNARDVKVAAGKIQAAYRGFQTGKNVCTGKPAMIRTADSHSSSSEEAEALPDLNATDVRDATVKIQAAYKGFQTRKRAAGRNKFTDDERKQTWCRRTDSSSSSSEEAEELPDLDTKEVKDAAIKIQAAYKGFQARKRVSAAETMRKVVAIKGAEMKFTDSRSRQKMGKRTNTQSSSKEEVDELPDLNAKDVQEAAVKIQAVYKGFQSRKTVFGKDTYKKVTDRTVPTHTKLPITDELDRRRPVMTRIPPETAARPLAHEKLKERKSEELLRHPGDVVAAAITLQRFFRRWRIQRQSRKALAKKRRRRKKAQRSTSSSSGSHGDHAVHSHFSHSSSSSSSSSATELESGERSSTSEHDSEDDNTGEGKKDGKDNHRCPPSSSSSESADSQSESDSAESLSSNQSSTRAAQMAALDTTQRKEPETQRKHEQEAASAPINSIHAAKKSHMTGTGLSADLVATSLHTSAIEGQKAKPTGSPHTPNSPRDLEVSPPLPPERKGASKSSSMNSSRLVQSTTPTSSQEFGVKMTLKSPLPARSTKLKEVAIPTVPATQLAEKECALAEDVATTKVQKEQSSMFHVLRQSSLGNMFKKTDNAIATSALDADSSNQRKNPGNAVVATAPNTEDKNPKPASASGGFFNSFLRRSEHKKRNHAKLELKKGEGSRGAKVAPPELQASVQRVGMEPQKNKNGTLTQKQFTKKGLADNEDLIHVVLNAVEENWLNQAPQPTLDKAQALRGHEHETAGADLSEVSESEKDTHEFEKMKREQRELDDEATRGLWPKRSVATVAAAAPSFAACNVAEGDEDDLPYLESTLPQERGGFTVTITPSYQRVSAECKLASMSRPPRSASIIQNKRLSTPPPPPPPPPPPEKQQSRSGPAEKIKVMLPKQDSKARIRLAIQWREECSGQLLSYISANSQGNKACPGPEVQKGVNLFELS